MRRITVEFHNQTSHVVSIITLIPFKGMPIIHFPSLQTPVFYVAASAIRNKTDSPLLTYNTMIRLDIDTHPSKSPMAHMGRNLIGTGLPHPADVF